MHRDFGKSSRIASTMKPILLASHICGITYFRRDLKSKWIFLYRSTVLVTLILCFVHEIPSITFWIVNSKSLHAMLAAFETSLRWFLVFFNNVLTVLRNAKIVEVVRALDSLDLNPDGKREKKIYGVQIFLVGFNFSVMTCYMILGHHFIWYNANIRWYTSILYIYTEFYINFGNVQFTCFSYYVFWCFKRINQNLSQIQKDMKAHYGGYEFMRMVIRNRRLHLKLSRLSEKLNGCYSMQVLFFVFLAFVEIIYSMRSFFLFFVGKKHSDVWQHIPIIAFVHMVLWGGYFFCTVLQIVVACDSVANESKYSSLLVHKLINKTKDPALEKELELFSMQITKNEVRFTGAGLFSLDFTLIHSIIAAVTTYLVVLISVKDED